MQKLGSVAVAWVALAAGLSVSAGARAGSLDAPAAPTSSDSAMFTMQDIYRVLDTRTTNVAKRTGGFTEPTAGPTNGTMCTLNAIMTLVTNRAPVPKTGSFRGKQAGDDGTNRLGVAWPVPRFTTNSVSGAEVVFRDNLTGLMWTKNANLPAGQLNWSNALVYCNTLTYGGLTGWRLLNARELSSLLDYGRYYPANPTVLPSGHPFASVQMAKYWSSTSYAYDGGNAWWMDMSYGTMGNSVKTSLNYVWPVRGGR